MFRNIVVLALILAGIVALPAAQLKEARVTEVVKDVKLLPTGSAPRPAAVSDEVRDGTAVRTGMESRSELKFPDQTLARLGANTVFSFNEGTRSLNLQDGAMLLRVPKGAGGAKISSSAITAAITGTTVMVETHPLTKKGKDSYYKFIVLEGTARLSLPGQLGESVLVKAGQMIIMPTGAKKIPEAVDVDIQKIMQSSLLITGFAPLASEQLIALEETRQTEQKKSGQLHETNLMIAGGGTNVILGDPNQVDVAVTAQKSEGSGPFSSPTPTPTATPTPTPTPTATPSATPSKFGTPVPITSPDPYVITSGTTITTDPTITTNGVTDSGKIYQGAAIDGPASAWGFGSTSAFDTASGFDSQVIGPGAAFKFTALELTGNPTISTANGDVNLGLIAVNGITSGPPGGALTFSGIRGLLLATQNGPIALGPEISFSGLHDITLYARGAGSVLTLASDISTTSAIRLYGENAVLATSNLSTQTLTVAAGTTISVGGAGSTTINASEASLLIPNSGSGNIPGAAIALLSAGNLAFTGSNGLSLTIDNTNGGHIGQDAIVSLTAPNLNAGSLNVLVNNRDSGSIGAAALLACNISGNLTTQGDAIIGISNRNDGLGGGSIGGSATVTVQANNISVGGELDGFVSANGGHIGNIGALVFNVTGDLHSGAGMFFETQATAFNGSGGSLTPGFIGSDALVGVNAGVVGQSVGNITSDGFIDGDILTTNGGHIVGNASVALNATGDINGTQGIAGIISLANGGKIDASALVVLNAQNIITASTATGTPGVDTMALEASIYPNVNGTVGGDALVNVQAVQNITAPGMTLFWVANGNYQSLGPGTITGDAEVDVTATNISTGNLLAQILNYGGSTIGSFAEVNVNATTLSVNGTLDSRIDNTAGTIHGDASLIFNTATAVTSTGDQFYQIINADGGTIGGSATLDVTTKNLSAGRSLFVAILNSTNDNGATGTIASDATIDFNVSGTATVATDATFQINGSDSAANSTINFNGGTYNIGSPARPGTFEGFMDGSGTMTFNSTTINADTVKVGIFGTNGTLRIGGIGGSNISANTLLHLYAPGSNGMIDFVGNTSLNSSGTAAVIAANTVTIENGVVVTIGGSTPANVFANVANYSGRNGGNNSTTGTFAGAGATTPQPLDVRPPFDGPSARLAAKQTSSARSGGGIGHTIHITDSSQLGSLLEKASAGRDGKVRVASATIPHPASANKTTALAPRSANTPDRHRSADMNVGSKMVASRLP
jgi:FecR-like protein